SLSMYALSALSKETALSLVLLIFAYELIGRRKGDQRATPTARASKNPDSGLSPANLWQRATRAAAAAAPYAGVTVAYLIARYLVLGGLTWKNPNAHQGPFVDTILTLPLVVSTYVLHLIWPINLSTMYQTHYVTEAASAEFIIPAAALAIIAGSLIVRRDRVSREVWIAVALIAVPLLPVLDLRQISEEYLVSDRYLFLPAAGWCYLIALGVSKVSYVKKPLSAGDRFAPGLRVLRGWIPAAGFLVLIAGYTFGSARENSH